MPKQAILKIDQSVKYGEFTFLFYKGNIAKIVWEETGEEATWQEVCDFTGRTQYSIETDVYELAS